MKLIERYKKLTFWNKFSFWGAVASIVGILLTISLLLLKKDSVANKNNDFETVREIRDYNILCGNKENRTYLLKSPKELLESVSNLTDLQANLLVEQIYKGKWIKIQGPIYEVRGTTNYVQLIFNIQGIITRIQLADDQVTKATHLVRGDVITIEAKFKTLDQIGPDFEDGIIINKQSEK